MATGTGGYVNAGVGAGVAMGTTTGVGSGVGAGVAVGTGVGDGVADTTETGVWRVVVRVFFDPHPVSSVTDSNRQVTDSSFFFMGRSPYIKNAAGS